jgi:hypothetical protein
MNMNQPANGTPSPTPSQHLIDLLGLGFTKLGEWNFENDHFDFRESNDPKAQAILGGKPSLYAHVVDGQVKYVGKTTQVLRKRIYGYRRPGNTQATNARCRNNLRDAVAAGRCAETYGWLPPDQLCFGDFAVDLAAGLEDSMIDRFDPPWNGGKTETEKVEEETTVATDHDATEPAPAEIDSESESSVAEVSTAQAPAKKPCTGTVQIKLGKTYWDTGFMNPGTIVDKLLGEHGQPVTIQLGWNGKTATRTIDRNANPNGTVRIYGGRAVRDWWQRHFHQGDTVNACILNPNWIVLLLP